MKKQILIIEDDELFSDLYSQKLTKEGYQVDVAADGVAGLEKLKDVQPDLVLLDLVMPHMSGLKFLEAYRNTHKLSPARIVVVSNRTSDAEMKRSRELGVIDYLIKAQYTPDQIVAKIQAHVNE